MVDSELSLDTLDLVEQHDIGFADQPLENARARLGGVVERQAELVPVHGEEPEGLAVVKGRAPCARVVAAFRTLDLHDRRAKIAEQLTGIGTRDRSRQVEYPGSGEKTQAGSGAADGKRVGRDHRLSSTCAQRKAVISPQEARAARGR